MNSVSHDFENLRLAIGELMAAYRATWPCRFMTKVLGWIEDHL